jgi:hypothetical protein
MIRLGRPGDSGRTVAETFCPGGMEFPDPQGMAVGEAEPPEPGCFWWNTRDVVSQAKRQPAMSRRVLARSRHRRKRMGLWEAADGGRYKSREPSGVLGGQPCCDHVGLRHMGHMDGPFFPILSSLITLTRVGRRGQVPWTR